MVPAAAESEWVNAKPAAMVMTPPVNNRSVRKRRREMGFILIEVV